MKRIISVILITVLSLLTFVSCGDKKYDEENVKNVARELISSSVVLNDIFWGKGLPYTVDRDTADGSYYEADFAYHKELGFETLDELMTIAGKTFSKEQCSVIESTVLSSINVGDETMNLSRYYQKVLDGKPVCIMVNSLTENLIIGEAVYDLDSIEVIGSEKDTVFVTVKATITYKDYEPQIRTVRVALVEEDAGWRIDSPTYISFDKTNLK